MDIIDEQGRLLGTINVIDALVVLLVLAVLVAGIALVTGQNSPSQSQTERITVQASSVHPAVATAIPEKELTNSSIISVTNKSVRPSTVVVRADNGTLHERSHPVNRTVTIDVTLSVRESESGGQTEYYFREEPLEIGRTLSLDFGRVSVNGTVTDFKSISR